MVQKCRDVEWDVDEIMRENGWGNEDGRSLIVTRDHLPRLWQAMTDRPREGKGKQGEGVHGKVKMGDEIDVKDLLMMGRIIVEKRALDSLLKEHQTDLTKEVARATYS